MANQVEHLLNDTQFELLQKETFMLLSTYSQENQSPMVNAISWVYAKDRQSLLFAVDNRSVIVRNINTSPNVVLTLIDAESTYSIKGRALILTERIDEIPLKLAKIEVAIEEVRDVMFYGAKISKGPDYDKTYDKEAAAKLDRQVMTALQQ
ncbi:pyridoxamine 5'-phosphate oxidase family protein [Thalassobacillus devorans]|uniref:pyridoxamine 5'-phosphate oxidase family protein n=1 Tax=Thalassobacillus devorans TaxID=279813 RepID=UPI00048FF78E|nr:pyridoxamine 5'-phosphate oxidase family protein [Thalassobacillus devorans]